MKSFSKSVSWEWNQATVCYIKFWNLGVIIFDNSTELLKFEGIWAKIAYFGQIFDPLNRYKSKLGDHFAEKRWSMTPWPMLVQVRSLPSCEPPNMVQYLNQASIWESCHAGWTPSQHMWMFPCALPSPFLLPPHLQKYDCPTETNRYFAF